MGKDHVRNINLRVKLVITFIFTDIQVVKVIVPRVMLTMYASSKGGLLAM